MSNDPSTNMIETPVSCTDYQQPQIFSPTQWVSSRELAEYFSVSTKTVDRWRKRGVISEFAVKLPGRGKGFRYDLKKIEKSFFSSDIE